MDLKSALQREHRQGEDHTEDQDQFSSCSHRLNNHSNFLFKTDRKQFQF